jgi:predicted phosphoadenosine phosphosulfate sulfurtransferase
MSAPSFYKDPFDATQRTSLDLYPVAGSQEWPRLIRKAGCNDSLYRADFDFVHGHGYAIGADNPDDPRRHQNGESIVEI